MTILFMKLSKTRTPIMTYQGDLKSREGHELFYIDIIACPRPTAPTNTVLPLCLYVAGL